ncbi:Cytochrome c oxidase subunit 6A2, mitochondrial [Anthophora retusa]
MSILSLMCRLRVPTSLLVNDVTRSPLIRSNLAASREAFSTGRHTTGWLDGGKSNRSVEYGRRDSVVHAGNRECNIEMTKCIGRGGSSIVLQLGLAPNRHYSWMFSKQLRPSTGYHGLNIRKLSNPMLKFYSSSSHSSCEKFSREKLKRTSDLCEMKFRLGDTRGYSSCKPDCDKPTKPCRGQKSCTKERGPEDCSTCGSEVKECTDTERVCSPVPEEIPVTCVPPPCQNVNDYCQPYVYPQEKFWQMWVIIAIPVLIFMSARTYSRELEKRKQPRMEYKRYRYLGRINKPFPWGDGRRSFFHNPVKNPIAPHGYEVEDPNAVKKSERK